MKIKAQLTMNNDLLKYLEKLKETRLDPDLEARLREELVSSGECHAPPDRDIPLDPALARAGQSLYSSGDLLVLSQAVKPYLYGSGLAKSLDELLERDRLREQDGFPRKIQVGKLIKPGRGRKGKIVVVPTTVEEKFFHDPTIHPPGEGGNSGGTGEEKEGEVIGEQPVREDDGQSGSGPGEGGGGNHEMESSAYDLGKTLSEKFQLPNLKDKGKKRSFTRYTYDLTDKNRGFGQVLDKKATLRKIVETNIALGNLPDVSEIDTSQFLIAPHDKVYRVLSREKDYEPQAMLFFLRDYSGSMVGKVTDLVVSQHVMIYSWLLYQYGGQAETRFILHDTEAREVPDFYTYYNSRVAGGTQVSSAYKLVNEIVERENLTKDYNIYIFQGTDGDDWDESGSEALPELEKILTYASRVGITIAEHWQGEATTVVRYLNSSGLLKKMPDRLRMDVMQKDADETRLIEGIKKLIS